MEEWQNQQPHHEKSLVSFIPFFLGSTPKGESLKRTSFSARYFKIVSSLGIFFSNCQRPGARCWLDLLGRKNYKNSVSVGGCLQAVIIQSVCGADSFAIQPPLQQNSSGCWWILLAHDFRYQQKISEKTPWQPSALMNTHMHHAAFSFILLFSGSLNFDASFLLSSLIVTFRWCAKPGKVEIIHLNYWVLRTSHSETCKDLACFKIPYAFHPKEKNSQKSDFGTLKFGVDFITPGKNHIAMGVGNLLLPL